MLKLGLGILVGLLLAFTGFYLYSNFSSKNDTNYQNSEVPSTPLVNQEDLTAKKISQTKNTKLFVNEKLNISFMYPENWKIELNETGDIEVEPGKFAPTGSIDIISPDENNHLNFQVFAERGYCYDDSCTTEDFKTTSGLKGMKYTSKSDPLSVIYSFDLSERTNGNLLISGYGENVDGIVGSVKLVK